jgi:hypothetical protein
MEIVERDHVVEHFASNATDPALGDSVLPRTSHAGSDWLEVTALQEL